MAINIRLAHLFSALDDAQVEQVLASSHTMTLKDGEQLFAAGMEAKRFFLVLGGQIKLFRVSPGGDEKIIEIVHTGNTFAEALMFMNSPVYPVSAMALGPARVTSFDNEGFLRILRESRETCFRIMGTMSQRLRGLIKEIDELTLQNATTRTCSMLLNHMEKTGDATFNLPVAKGVLAARLSVKPETFSRIFHTLSQDQIIEVSGSKVRILDEEKLRALACQEAVVGLEPDSLHNNPCVNAGPIKLN